MERTSPERERQNIRVNARYYNQEINKQCKVIVKHWSRDEVTVKEDGPDIEGSGRALMRISRMATNDRQYRR